MHETLGELIARGRPLPPLQALHLASLLGDALEAERARGKRVGAFVPREMHVVELERNTPERIELTSLTAEARAALDVEEKYPYRAPELDDGAAETEAAAVYLLAAVAYALLSGAPAYRGRTAEGIAVRKRVEAAPRLRAWGRELPDTLDAALRAALHPDPAHRPASIGQLRASLRFEVREISTDPPDSVPPTTYPGLEPEEPRALPRGDGPLFIGNYRCEKLLGVGGMGVVYQAMDTYLNRHIAVKVMRADLAANPSAAAWFQREASLAASLDHPNVVTIYHYDKLDSALVYIAMELVDGSSLAKLLEERGGALQLDRALDLARQIGRGLQAAHEKGIIHRDLKPENILVARKPVVGMPGDFEDVAKVADFGIASAVGSPLESDGSGIPVGTPLYMSPEQARAASDLDPRTDVFSFGLIVYQMLSGVLPFRLRGEPPLAVIIARSKLDRPPPPLREANPDLNLPPAVDEVLARALAPDRALRTRTPLRVIDALDAAIAAHRG